MPYFRVHLLPTRRLWAIHISLAQNYHIRVTLCLTTYWLIKTKLFFFIEIDTRKLVTLIPSNTGGSKGLSISLNLVCLSQNMQQRCLRTPRNSFVCQQIFLHVNIHFWAYTIRARTATLKRTATYQYRCSVVITLSIYHHCRIKESVCMSVCMTCISCFHNICI